MQPYITHTRGSPRKLPIIRSRRALESLVICVPTPRFRARRSISGESEEEYYRGKKERRGKKEEEIGEEQRR